VNYARRAGERAVGVLAYEEAVRLFRMALQGVELQEPVDPRTRCDLLVALGDAQARAGEGHEARATFLRAAEAARTLGAPEHLARAALGFGGRFMWARAGTDEHLVPLLDEALRALGDEESPLRVRVMSRLAGALRDQHDRKPRDSLSREAVEIARRLDDPGALAYALSGRWAAIFWPENPEERRAIVTELVRLAEQTGDRELAHEAHYIRDVGIPLELGDLATVRAELENVARLTVELHQPAQRWLLVVTRAMLALFEGRFQEAEALVEEAFTLGERAQQHDAVLSHRVQRFTLGWQRGEVQGLEEMLVRSAAEYPARPMFRCMLALLYTELERPEDAREVFEPLATDGFAALPVTNEWLFSMGFLAEVAARLGDLDRAREIYELLLPYAARNASTPDYIATGSVSRPLGILAGALGRWSEAERHFDEALDKNERMGARPWVARTQHDFASMLLARDVPGDRERAAALVGAALAAARELAMSGLEAQVAALAESGGGLVAPVIQPRPTALSVFRLEGDYWSIAFEGDAFRLKDVKGLHYLARLLAEPGREFHALDLVAAERGTAAERRPRETGLATAGFGDAGEILDAQAKAAYRQRLTDLEEEMDEARAQGDEERAARAEAARALLVSELAQAVGLGGRSRMAASASERARVSVTQAIRAAIRRIAGHSPSLEGHLKRTIRTGTFCSYAPDPRVPVDWRP
jgi:tetratricopeptide (TPR) repeat protein